MEFLLFFAGKMSSLKIKQDQTDNTKPEKNTSETSNATSGWHVQSGYQYTMFLHSAFYDDRSPYKTASLRIITVSDINTTRRIYCDLWYEGNPKPYAIIAKVIIGYFHETDQLIYKYVKSRGLFHEYIFSCNLPKSNFNIPDHVSLRTDKVSTSAIRLPVMILAKPKMKIDMGVCDFALFVEWVELNKLFGVEEFNVYFAYMRGNMRTLLEYYNTTGEVIYHSMPPIIPVPPEDSVAKHYVRLNSLPSLNHCLFTNMHRYTNIAVIDYDEVIIPQKHMNYSELIQALNKEYNQHDNWASVEFRNVYFFRDFGPDTSQPQYLPMMQYRLKSKPCAFGERQKSFINPRTCLATGNHFCIHPFTGQLRIDVSTDIATSHHYRLCPDYLNCTHYMSSATQDDILLNYKEHLMSKTIPVLEKLHYFT